MHAPFIVKFREEATLITILKLGNLQRSLTTDVHEFKSAFKLCISQGIRSSTQVKAEQLHSGYVLGNICSRLL